MNSESVIRWKKKFRTLKYLKITIFYTEKGTVDHGIFTWKLKLQVRPFDVLIQLFKNFNTIHNLEPENIYYNLYYTWSLCELI